MNLILEAVALERSEITARLQALDEIERLARVFDAGPLEIEEAPVAPVSKPKRVVSESVRSLPPARRSQPQPRSASSRPEMGDRRRQLLALVGEMEPVSVRDLMARTDISHHQLRNDLASLRDDGLLRCIGKTQAARWHLTATLDRQTAEKHGKQVRPRGARDRCRDFVLGLVRNDPGALTEQRLTQAGEWDREDIADACGGLLEAGDVVLNGDGTYTLASLGVAA